MDERTWARELNEQRMGKDVAFRSDPGSPVAGQAFSRLAYYKPDPSYRMIVSLQKDAPEGLRIPRSGGDEVEYLRVGTFAVETPTGRGRLAAFRSPGHGHDLWVPFRDATSGKETYGAGRYVEAKPMRDGHWLLDLNQAYHPFCAYNEAFTCPMVPAENHLDFPVPVGEKL